MAFLDPFRKAVGMPAVAEIDAAQAERARTIASAAPIDRYVQAVADRLHKMPYPEVMKRMPEAGMHKDGLPRNEDMRWKAVADMVREQAERGERIHGVDKQLGSHQANQSYLDAARTFDGKKPIKAHLEDTRQGVKDGVRGMLVRRDQAEISASRHAAALMLRPDAAIEGRLEAQTAEFIGPARTGRDRGAWLNEASRVQFAMARTGTMRPVDVVEASRDVASTGSTFDGGLRPVDWQKGAERNGYMRRAIVLDEAGVETPQTKVMAKDPSTPAIASPSRTRAQGVADMIAATKNAPQTEVAAAPAAMSARRQGMAAMLAAGASRA